MTDLDVQTPTAAAAASACEKRTCPQSSKKYIGFNADPSLLFGAFDAPRVNLILKYLDYQARRIVKKRRQEGREKEEPPPVHLPTYVQVGSISEVDLGRSSSIFSDISPTVSPP